MAERRPYIDKTNPEIYKALANTSNEVRKAASAAGLTDALLEIVFLRVSQINGCVTCLSIHAREARKAGVSQVKLDILAAWRESSLFDDTEKAALVLAESLANIDHAEDRFMTIEFAKQFLTEPQITALEWAIIIIGAFNRVSIASGHPALP